MPNFVSFAASIAELAHGKKSHTHSHTQSLSHPSYLMPWESKLVLRDNWYFIKCSNFKQDHQTYHQSDRRHDGVMQSTYDTPTADDVPEWKTRTGRTARRHNCLACSFVGLYIADEHKIMNTIFHVTEILTFSRAEVSTGYTSPSRSNLHFKFLTFGHSGAQPWAQKCPNVRN